MKFLTFIGSSILAISACTTEKASEPIFGNQQQAMEVKEDEKIQNLLPDNEKGLQEEEAIEEEEFEEDIINDGIL